MERIASDLPEASGRQRVFSVTRLNALARDVLEQSFPPLWVEGEVSNLSRPASGHLYFTLKDERCQVRCAMFRSRNRHLRFPLEDGAKVLAHATVGFYPERGEFQLVVEYLEESGAGALRRAFDALKERLAAEGLFAESGKRELPPVPTQIGLITSPSGAAVRDILSVLRRRFRSVPVLIYPVPVQGKGAPAAIADALRTADARQECDVLILARGGGSIEDLQAFNDERVARAIHACRIPIVTGVGHETDFTIADFAADRRGATPSAAAALVVPEAEELERRRAALEARVHRLLARKLEEAATSLRSLRKRLVHPRQQLQHVSQRADDLTLRLNRAIANRLSDRRGTLAVIAARLERYEPSALLEAYRSRREHLSQKLAALIGQELGRRRAELHALGRTLDAVGPADTLRRGYAIVTTEAGVVVREATSLGSGTRIRARLAKGSLLASVDEVEE